MQWIRICLALVFLPLLGKANPSFLEKEAMMEVIDKESDPPFPQKSEESNSFDAKMGKVTESYETALVKTVGAFLGLLTLVILTIWILRKMGRARFLNGTSLKSIKILERRPLSPKSILYLIEVDQKQILIAESQLQVRSVMSLSCLSINREF